LDNWVSLGEKGQLKGAGGKPVSAEQMELARLRAQLARVTMERGICAAHGVVQAPSRTWADLSFRPGQPVLQP
jgi:transposase-like protein